MNPSGIIWIWIWTCNKQMRNMWIIDFFTPNEVTWRYDFDSSWGLTDPLETEKMSHIYCMCFYSYSTPLCAAHLRSSYTKCSMQKLHVASNDAMRIVLKVPRGGSASQMFVSVRSWHTESSFKKCDVYIYAASGWVHQRYRGGTLTSLCELLQHTSRLGVRWLKCLHVF